MTPEEMIHLFPEMNEMSADEVFKIMETKYCPYSEITVKCCELEHEPVDPSCPFFEAKEGK